MSTPAAIEIRRLAANDLEIMDAMLSLYGQVFADPETYDASRPPAEYTRRLLADDDFVALAALDGGRVVGALTAYELHKFEQARSEIYIYDLAVDESCRRRGVATALIETVRSIAAERGAWVVVVQADKGDDAPIALYDKLGTREEVLHFDIPPRPRTPRG
jgi:aminoglycoside 3-N-acetyltransferase I